MAKAAQPSEGRRANRRGAARLAAVQALYQMDLAATPLNEAQAWARARISEQDKGGDAARAALALIAIKRQRSKR